MGTVWRAYDEILGRDVAIKEISPPMDLAGEEQEAFFRRTFREARAAGRVSHPGVAAIYDVVEDRGHPWIAMELLPPRTLGQVIRERGRLPPAEAAEIGAQILAALRAAHAVKVLHRDVKPDNVLLTPSGRAVLTDFGIATMEGDSSVTRSGAIIGTPAFIAPERAAGGPAGRASDLWSLGVTLYVAVEGRNPFHRGNVLATLSAIRNEEPAPFAHAGPLAPVIAGLLDKDPARRMTAEQLEPRLHAIAARSAPQPTVPIVPPAARAVRSFRLGTSAMAGVGALILGVGMVTGGLAWFSHPDTTARPAAPQIARTPHAPPPSPPERVRQRLVIPAPSARHREDRSRADLIGKDERRYGKPRGEIRRKKGPGRRSADLDGPRRRHDGKTTPPDEQGTPSEDSEESIRPADPRQTIEKTPAPRPPSPSGSPGEPGGYGAGSGLGSQPFQGLGEVGGVVAGESDAVARRGMVEGQGDGVQPLAGKAQPGGQGGVGPVQEITDTRVPQSGHVDPDLVGAPGLQIDVQQ